MARQELKVIIRAKDAFSKTMASATKAFGVITRAAKIAAVAIGGVVTALAAVAITTAKAGDEFQKMALRTGLSAQALSEMKKAAELSGSSIQTFEKGVKTLAKRISDANFGLETYQRIFRELNIEYKTASGELREVDDVFLDAVDSINKLGSETAKAALAQELFGKAGTQMLPLIKAGREGIEEMRASARRLGLTFTDLEANQAAAFTDRLSDAKDAVKGLWFSLGKQLIPTFTVLLEKFTTFLVDSPLVSTAIDAITTAVKGLAEIAGFEAFTALEKVNQEIAFMQTADAFTFFETGAAWAAELNRLLAERTRLIALNAAEEEKARQKRTVIDLAPPSLGPDQVVLDAEIADFERREALADKEMAAFVARSKQKANIEKNLQNRIMGFKFAAANQGIALLSMLGEKNKTFALAALAAQKGLAMANVFISTQAASAAALMLPPIGLGPIVGAPLAASIKLWGKVQMGLIAATGLFSAAGGGGGAPSGVGGGGGVGALPIAAPTTEPTAQAPVVNITINTPTGEIPQGFVEEILSGIDFLSTQNIFISDRALGRT